MAARLKPLVCKRLFFTLPSGFSNVLLTRPTSWAPYRPIEQSPTTKALSTSPCLTWPHSTPSVFRSQESAPPSPKKVGHKEEPPRPYNEIPFIKNFLGLNLEMMKDPYHMVEHTIKIALQHGYIFKMSGPPSMPAFLFVIDPKDVEKVFRVVDAGYPKRFPINEWMQVREELKIPFGMFLEDGEIWHNQRMPISKFIMMPRKMAEYHQPFNDVVFDFMKLVRSKRGKDDSFSDVVLLLNKWSLESVSLFVLGKRLGCLEEEMPPECKQFVDNIHSFMETTSKLFFSLPFHKIWRTKNWKALVNSFDDLYTYASGQVNEKIREIEEADKSGESETVDAELGMDFLTYMIHSGTMSVEELAVNAIDLLTAGVDTTSLTMAGCLYCMANNPDVQDKLREEVQRVVGDDEMVTPQHIQEMHYLRDCIKETQRLYPIAPNNTRILKEDVVLSGYHVPAGTPVILPITVPGRLPEFFPEPKKFRPERWSRDSKEVQSSFASLPFGFGRRSCVGRRVAELEMNILLAQVVKNFKIEYREDKPIEFITKIFYQPERQIDLAFVDV